MDQDRRPDDTTPTAAPGTTSGAGGVPPTAVATATPPPAGPPRRGSRGLIAAVAVIAVVALGVAGWMYLSTAGAQRAAVERLDEATALVEQADAVVLDVDEIVRAPIDEGLGERASEVATQVPDAIAALDDALALIAEARPDLPSGDVAYAVALRDSAEARIEMLELAGPILEANRKASVAITASTAGWDLILEAETLSTQAAQEYSKLTREGVTRSTDLANEAIAKTNQARALFSEAATGFPEVDFSAYVEYTEKKVAALEISKQADVAWLNGRIADANTLGAQYNQAEQELAQLAAALPSSPVVLVAAAYEQVATAPTEAYFEARARATAADARLRATNGDLENGDGVTEPPAEETGTGEAAPE